MFPYPLANTLPEYLPFYLPNATSDICISPNGRWILCLNSHYLIDAAFGHRSSLILPTLRSRPHLTDDLKVLSWEGDRLVQVSLDTAGGRVTTNTIEWMPHIHVNSPGALLNDSQYALLFRWGQPLRLLELGSAEAPLEFELMELGLPAVPTKCNIQCGAVGPDGRKLFAVIQFLCDVQMRTPNGLTGTGHCEVNKFLGFSDGKCRDLLSCGQLPADEYPIGKVVMLQNGHLLHRADEYRVFGVFVLMRVDFDGNMGLEMLRRCTIDCGSFDVCAGMGDSVLMRDREEGTVRYSVWRPRRPRSLLSLSHETAISRAPASTLPTNLPFTPILNSNPSDSSSSKQPSFWKKSVEKFGKTAKKPQTDGELDEVAQRLYRNLTSNGPMDEEELALLERLMQHPDAASVFPFHPLNQR